MRDDRAHRCRLADDAAVRAQAAFLQVGDHQRRAGAADFLVEGQREVDGLASFVACIFGSSASAAPMKPFMSHVPRP